MDKQLSLENTSIKFSSPSQSFTWRAFNVRSKYRKHELKRLNILLKQIRAESSLIIDQA